MKPVQMIHSGSVKQENNRHFEILRTVLSDFKGWTMVDVSGVRGANDDIALIMFVDDKKRFKQYNKKHLVEAFKAIVDDVAISDKQWEFMADIEKSLVGTLVQTKDLSFADTTLCFTKQGRSVSNHVTFNVVQRINK